MKKSVISFIISVFCFFGVFGQTATLSTPGGVPGLKWTTDSVFSTGQIGLNKPVTVTFGFINNGKAPLVISRVEPSCGCTNVEYTKEPIGPNQKGFVKATYNAASVGVFSKNVTVFSNAADMRKVLVIKGEVIQK